jgi:glycosyltransferase involved in cell wall biosynthesis
MLAVVIATQNDGETLTEALSALVPAAVDGLVKQVIVVDGGSTDKTLEIADDAGATILNVPAPKGGRLLVGCLAATTDWLFVLPPRRCLAPDWEAGVCAHLLDSHGAATGEVVPKRGILCPWRKTGEALLIPTPPYFGAGSFREVDAPEADLLHRLQGWGVRPLRVGI